MSRVQLIALLYFLASRNIADCSSYWHPNPVKYVGDYLSAENASYIDFCDKKICLIDADRTALWMNESANPCDNFTNFACGSFAHYQALHERNAYQGLWQIYSETIDEQYRKLLSAPITDKDITPHVIAKAMFQKCVDSRYILKNGKKDVFDFMDTLGGFPMYEGDSWNSTRLNKSILFEDYPHLMLGLFDIKFGPEAKSRESPIHYLTLHIEDSFGEYADLLIESFKKVLTEIGIKSSEVIENDFKAIEEFFRKYDDLQKLHPHKKERTFVTIKEFANRSGLKVNWLKIIRGFLSFEIDENYRIELINLELIESTFNLFNSMDDRLFGNLVQLHFLYYFSEVFALYLENHFFKTVYEIQHAPQRFLQCVNIVIDRLPVAFVSLLKGRFTTKRMIDDAYELANRTMEIIIKDVDNDNLLPLENKRYMLDKLRSVKLILGYPKELLDAKNVEQVYKDLNLTGRENFLKLMVETFYLPQYQELKNFVVSRTDHTGIERIESTRWIDYTFESVYVPDYKPDVENTIYFGSIWFQNEPFFHVDRPRYYKDSIFSVYLSNAVIDGLDNYAEYKNITWGQKDSITLVYEDYAKWDDLENKDQPLPGLLFSNKQFFWLAFFQARCLKIQPGYTGDDGNLETNKDLEDYFRRTKAFYESFGCDFSKENLTNAMKKK